MSPSRRSVLKWSATSALGLLALGCSRRSVASIAGETTVLLNHVGFTPQGGKIALLPAGISAKEFAVHDAETDAVVFKGELKERALDLGRFQLADFGSLDRSGTYLLRAGGIASAPFAISSRVYLPAIRHSITYFTKQRCGDSRTGYNTPCHVDDGKRDDDGTHLDVTGGWHDACDVRKWVTATIYGMIGLAGVLDRLGPTGEVDADAIIDELRWGNLYFLKMQSPDGFVMDHCGGDQGNNFTDNQIGTADDRVIRTEACELPAQYNFIRAQAMLSRLTRDRDVVYSKQCATAANKAFDWCLKNRNPRAATSLAAALMALCELRHVIDDNRLLLQLREWSRRLIALQAKAVESGAIDGFFVRSHDDAKPSREIMHGNVPLQALCAIVEHFPTHPDANAWREALSKHVNYLLKMSERGTFGTVPFGLYTGNDPGGNRKVDNYWYRWFSLNRDEQRDSDWWVGINAHLASNGLGLTHAAKVLNRPQLLAVAQRQLDWIMGVNPFDASTITAVGRNQPKLFETGEFKPVTPLLPGGVMNGIGGTADDMPDLSPGGWNTCEYWTPMVAYTMLLMSHLRV